MEYLLLWLFCAIISATIAGRKARSKFAWFCLGILFGPFAFIVAALPAPPPAQSDMGECPDCLELVKVQAKKCRYCGCLLEQDEATRTRNRARLLRETINRSIQ